MLYHKQFKHPSSQEWVTFIHGAGGSSSIWFKQLKSFTEKYNVLLIDLRGHGNSKDLQLKSLPHYTINNLSREVVDVIEHLKIQASHFVGISLGSIIVREIADIIPQKMRSMILAGAILEMNFFSRALMKFGYWTKSILPYMFLYKIFAFVIMPRKKHKQSRQLFITEAKKLYQKEFIRWFKLATSVKEHLRLIRINDPGIPTLYLMGEEDYMFLQPARITAKNHPSAQLVIVSNAGHVVNVDRPDLFNSLSLRFLKSMI